MPETFLSEGFPRLDRSIAEVMMTEFDSIFADYRSCTGHKRHNVRVAVPLVRTPNPNLKEGIEDFQLVENP